MFYSLTNGALCTPRKIAQNGRNFRDFGLKTDRRKWPTATQQALKATLAVWFRRLRPANVHKNVESSAKKFLLPKAFVPWGRWCKVILLFCRRVDRRNYFCCEHRSNNLQRFGTSQAFPHECV